MNTVTLIEPRVLTFGGLTVKRYLPSKKQKAVGPWLFFDHIGPYTFPPGQGVDVIPHPHINLSTVTYLFSGDMEHRDTLGSVQTITPGAINLMSAGSGIAHSERTGADTRERGHRLHGIQLWAGMTDSTEESPPAFDHYAADALPRDERGNCTVRVMMGSGFGLESPVVYSARILYLELVLERAGSVDLEIDEQQVALLCVEGDVSINGEAIPDDRLAIPSIASNVSISTASGCRLVVIGGAPLGRRYMWWNFVSSTRERIEKAKLDWKQGAFGDVIGETERAPLPESDSFSDMKE